MMDYLYAKFGDFSFSRFGFIMRTDRQTDRQNHRITKADDHYTHATTVYPLSSTWPHLNSDVGLEKGEY